MVNLMEPGEIDSAKAMKVVDVKDHDINVPADLGGNKVPFWQQDDMKIWIYVLAGAVIVLITVFALLSKQTSLFQGRTKLSSNSSVTVEDPEDTNVDGFNTNAANSETPEEEVVDAEEGEGDFGSSNNDEGADINDYLSGDGIVVDTPPATDNEVDYNDGLDDLWGLDIYDPGNEPVYDDPFNVSDSFQGHEAAQDGVVIDSELADLENTTQVGPNLNSNTEVEVLSSPDLQGETGPAPIAALFPTLLYAFYNRRKKARLT